MPGLAPVTIEEVAPQQRFGCFLQIWGGYDGAGSGSFGAGVGVSEL